MMTNVKCRTVVAALAGFLVGTGMAHADFILWDDEQLPVTTSHSLGTMYDRSRASIVSGGSVGELYAYDTSVVDISGGSVTWLKAYDTSIVDISGGYIRDYLYAYGTSVVDISGGSVYDLYARDTSVVDLSGGSVSTLDARNTSVVDISGGSVWRLNAHATSVVDLSGGSVSWVNAYDTSVVDISGGSVSTLDAYDTSDVTFHARDFRFGGGLSLDGDRVLGTGYLSGEWFDGTRWTVEIVSNASGATILAVAEPATLALLALGGVAVLRRRRSAFRA